MTLITEAFNKRKHKREGFDCKNDELNQYLLKYLSQDISKNLGMGYIYVDSDNGNTIAYYTIQFSEIGRENYTLQTTKQVHYSTVPAFLIGRLAVDQKYQGKKIGVRVLLDALRRCLELSNHAGGRYVVVDAIDDNAKAFYEKYGFISSENDSMRLMIPMKAVKKTLS